MMDGIIIKSRLIDITCVGLGLARPNDLLNFLSQICIFCLILDNIIFDVILCSN